MSLFKAFRSSRWEPAAAFLYEINFEGVNELATLGLEFPMSAFDVTIPSAEVKTLTKFGFGGVAQHFPSTIIQEQQITFKVQDKLVGSKRIYQHISELLGNRIYRSNFVILSLLNRNELADMTITFNNIYFEKVEQDSVSYSANTASEVTITMRYDFFEVANT